MERVFELAERFRIPVAAVVNKHDINPELTGRIEGRCRSWGIPVAGRIRYSREAVRAMIAGRAVVEHDDGPLAADVRAVWNDVERRLRRARAGREGALLQ